MSTIISLLCTLSLVMDKEARRFCIPDHHFKPVAPESRGLGRKALCLLPVENRE